MKIMVYKAWSNDQVNTLLYYVQKLQTMQEKYTAMEEHQMSHHLNILMITEHQSYVTSSQTWA